VVEYDYLESKIELFYKFDGGTLFFMFDVVGIFKKSIYVGSMLVLIY